MSDCQEREMKARIELAFAKGLGIGVSIGAALALGILIWSAYWMLHGVKP